MYLYILYLFLRFLSIYIFSYYYIQRLYYSFVYYIKSSLQNLIIYLLLLKLICAVTYISFYLSFSVHGRDELSCYISREMKGRSGGVLDNKYPIEIYAKSPEAILDDSFIYIVIFNLCDGARVFRRCASRYLTCFKAMHAICSPMRTSTIMILCFLLRFRGRCLCSVRRENFSLASRVKTKLRD